MEPGNRLVEQQTWTVSTFSCLVSEMLASVAWLYHEGKLNRKQGFNMHVIVRLLEEKEKGENLRNWGHFASPEPTFIQREEPETLTISPSNPLPSHRRHNYSGQLFTEDTEKIDQSPCASFHLARWSFSPEDCRKAEFAQLRQAPSHAALPQMQQEHLCLPALHGCGMAQKIVSAPSNTNGGFLPDPIICLIHYLDRRQTSCFCWKKK